MMIIAQFTFQIILLAVGFGVGYWLLMTASEQEGTLKIIGQTLGGILIVMALILAIFSSYYSMKIANRGYMQGGCPMNRNVRPADDDVEQPDNAEESDGRTNLEQNTNTQMINPQKGENGDSTKGEKRPIKRNIKDHE